MTLPRDPLTNTRGQVRADALRATARAVERHDRLTVGGGLNQGRGPGGDVVTDPRPGEILIRLIECDTDTGAYSWQQQYSDFDPDTNTVTYVDHDEGLSGTTTDLPAFEVNNNESIAPGVRAFARFSDDGECMLIVRCCTPQRILSGSGSGVGDDLVVTACCPNGLPRTLTASFSVTAGTCAALDGQSIAIGYNGTAWEGSDTLCGVTVSVSMRCVDVNPNSQVMYLTVIVGGQAFTTALEFHGGGLCDPLSIGISFQSLSGASATCCGGTATINVSVTT